MAVVNNINNVGSSDKTKTSNLSFDIGEKFAARVVSVDELKNEAILKMTDGWQFTAQIEKMKKNVTDGLLRFEVTGFQEGKILLKVVNKEGTEPENIDAYKKLFESLNIDINNEDAKLFSDIIKHNIPLTKENISDIKTLIDLREKVVNQKSEEFIDKYLQNKGIDKNSTEGQVKSNQLRDFFNQLGKLDNDDLLTMHENEIDITPENIKSFLKITKESGTIYNDLKSMTLGLNSDDSNVQDLRYESNSLDKNNLANKENSSLNKALPNETLSDNTKVSTSPLSGSSEEELIKMLKNLDVKDVESLMSEDNIHKKETQMPANNENVKANTKNAESNNITKENSDSSIIKNNSKVISDDFGILDDILDKTEEKDVYIKSSESYNPKENTNVLQNDLKQETPKEKTNVLQNDLKQETPKGKTNVLQSDSKQEIPKENKREHEITTTRMYDNTNDLNKDKISSEVLKGKINEKVYEMKEMVRDVISKAFDINKNDLDNVMSLNNNINDFKVFNSISNQYYYMNLPVEAYDNKYEFKLLVKDDREKGKKIDSKNVKMVVSVNTINIGAVDAYINVNNRNMKIDLKCTKDYVKLLDKNKQKLENALNGGNYNIFIDVSQKKYEVDIVNCRDFFNDNSISHINAKV